jgi:DNA mismatch repair protein MutL
MRRIRVLDSVTVNKIAAGEVVESPSSVIKELVENSLDADPKRISIMIEGGGIDRISVQDDGWGMSSEDATTAFLRHATSKIASIEDLSAISTLGFRGEALAAISAVSRVEMTTRERGSSEGTRIVVQAGKMLACEPVGCPEGTSVTVSDLFANVPARRKFLKSPQSEKARCIDNAMRFALVRPDVGFKVVVDGETRIESPFGEDLRSRAASVLGPKASKGMREIGPLDCGIARVRGLSSLPWDTRSNSAGITISVSGRIVRNRSLVDAIRHGYGSKLMKGRYPLAVIFIDLPADRTDVNIHPTKEIIKFSDEPSVLRCIERAVGRALFGGPAEPVRGKSAPQPPAPSSPIFEGSMVRPSDRPKQVPLLEGEVRPTEVQTSQWEDIPLIDGLTKLPPALPEDAKGLRMRIIGQLDRSYILCELGSDLVLVDQHAAHERIRLEALRSKSIGTSFPVQELIDPIVLDLDPSSMAALMAISDGLKGLGFALEGFGKGSLVVTGLPSFMGRIEGQGVLLDLAGAGDPHEGCGPPDPAFLPESVPMRDRIINLTACRGAIKAHHQLSLKEMEELMEDLLRCEVPLHCAHGRPTMIRLPLSALERWFKRVL